MFGLSNGFISTFSIYFISSVLCGKTQVDFSYKNTEKWSETFPDCGGDDQSPVALWTKNAKQDITYSTPLTIKGIDIMPKSIKLQNGGQQVRLQFVFEDSEHVSVSGGPLGSDVYNLFKVIYHWKSDENGSEHQVDGQSTAMEMQYLLYNSKYESWATAIDETDGMAIVSKLIAINDNPEKENEVNEEFRKFVKLLPNITNPGQEIETDPFTVKDLTTAEDIERGGYLFLHYNGSRTVPPCNKPVKWFVNNLPTSATTEMVNEFRKLKLKDNETRNSRPLQPLGNRDVDIISYSFS